ncbi:MAG: Beta-lactamase [Verrucomicrobiales bacterium]|nr:Beta-lactamase [Verrucomicrobiales bacterium]
MEETAWIFRQYSVVCRDKLVQHETVFMRKAKRWTACLIFWLAALCARADLIDDYITTQMAQRHIPGVSLALVRDGKLLKTKAYGKANLELGVPVTEETVFEIGSITKQFTATLIMMLAEEKKLGLDDKITAYFTNAPLEWTNVTVRYLLTHTSGIKNYTGLPGFECSKHLNSAHFVEAIGKHPLEFEPGTKFSYCNSGYNLLGFIVEKVAGKPYWQLLQDRIFQPAGMKASQSRDLDTIIRNRACGYEKHGNQIVNREGDLTDVFAAGAIASTVLDLLKWNYALESGKLLKASSLQQMWSPYKLKNGQVFTYGFGWKLDDYKGTRCIGHGGATSGFSSSLQKFPDLKLTVIVLTNSGEEGVAGQIAKGIAEFYIKTPKPVAQN